MTRDSDITRQIPWVGDLDRQPAGHCPGPELLAAFADARLGPDRQAEIEGHLADCSSCLDQVGFLIRQHGRPTPAVPTHLLDAVRTSRFHWLRWMPRPAFAAAAAAAVLALVVLTVPSFKSLSQSLSPDQQTTESSAGPSTDRSVRNGASLATKPVVLSPSEGATLAGPSIELRWQPFREALTYAVVVVSLQGDVVWDTTTTGTRASLSSARLVAGERYFVWVEAHLPSGGSIKSVPVGFRLAAE